MMTIDDLIAEKENLELKILKQTNDVLKEFQEKTGARVQGLTFSNIRVATYGDASHEVLFTDCECQIEYRGVKMGG